MVGLHLIERIRLYKIIDKTKKKGDGFSYYCPETRHLVVGRSWDALMGKAIKHRKVNNLSVLDNFQDIVEDAWCQQNPEMCRNEENNQPLVAAQVPIAYPSIVKQVKTFTKEMYEWIGQGMKRSEAELYKKRLDICRNCPRFSGSESMFGFRCKHPSCGCRMKIKAWIPNAKCPENPPRW